MSTPNAGGPAAPSLGCHDPEVVEQAVHVAANAMFLARRDGRICWVNGAFERLFGYGAEEVLGQTPSLLKSGRQTTAFYRELWDTILSGQVWRGHLSNRRKSGAVFDVEQTITPVCDAQGHASHFFVVYEDITERLRSEREIERLAMYDSVTGLANRNRFLSRLGEALARSRRSGRPLTVMLLDLDHFKSVNDHLGHAGGDELLGQVGRCLAGTLRETDLVARLSGDEFAVLVEDLARPEQAIESAQRLIDTLGEPFKVLGATLKIGGSVGIAVSGSGEDTPESLLRNADIAMYQAKSGGRGRFQFFDNAMDLSARRRHATELALREALREDRLELVYQPQLNMRTGELVGAEALLRWRDDALGSVPTAELLALAEQNGLIFAINDWVLHRAIAEITELLRAAPGAPPVAINVSAGQFDRVGFASSVEALLASHALNPSALLLEITETVMLRPSLTVHDNLRTLSRMGVRIAIDDFGTGYSSLPALRDFQIDVIKLDLDHVRGIGRSRRDEHLLRGIIGLGRHLGLAMIAEGVETTAQRDFLLREGCDVGQGYLFERELPVSRLAEWIQRGLRQGIAPESAMSRRS